MFFLNLTNSRTIKTMISIVDNGDKPIVITTPEGYVLFFNKSFLKMLNVLPDNIKKNILFLTENDTTSTE